MFDIKDDVRAIFVSDIHISLNPKQPVLMQAFCAFLVQLQSLKNLKSLYILGDFFDGWLGDDVIFAPPFCNYFAPLIDKLRQLSNNVNIYIMTGNRDFLLSQAFCDTFGGQMLAQPFLLQYTNMIMRLEHGDLLCTHDKRYQAYRRVIQNPISKYILQTLSLNMRQNIAKNIRGSAKKGAPSPDYITDVSAKALVDIFKNNKYGKPTLLIHGHTHKAAVHSLQYGKRIVLGDWRIQNSQNIKKPTKPIVVATIAVQYINYTDIALRDIVIDLNHIN